MLKLLLLNVQRHSVNLPLNEAVVSFGLLCVYVSSFVDGCLGFCVVLDCNCLSL